MELMHTEKWLDEELGNIIAALAADIETNYEVESNVNEVPYKSYDGFIPFTNGGIQLTAPVDLTYLVGSGMGFTSAVVTKSIDDTVEYCYTEARKTFIEQNLEALKALNHYTDEMLADNSDDVNYRELYLLDHGELAEQLSETEDEWLTDDLFIEHRIHFYSADNHRNETGADEMCFMSGVNLDYGYGRDKGLKITFEQTFKVKDLTPAVLETILKNMLQAI